MLETLISKVQKLPSWRWRYACRCDAAFDGAPGLMIGEEILKPSKWLIPVQGLLEIFGYFLLVLIGVELLETLKAYVKRT